MYHKKATEMKQNRRHLSGVDEEVEEIQKQPKECRASEEGPLWMWVKRVAAEPEIVDAALRLIQLSGNSSDNTSSSKTSSTTTSRYYNTTSPRLKREEQSDADSSSAYYYSLIWDGTKSELKKNEKNQKRKKEEEDDGEKASPLSSSSSYFPQKRKQLKFRSIADLYESTQPLIGEFSKKKTKKKICATGGVNCTG